MKKSEALLLAEIKKEFKAPIMEAIEPFAFAMIRARIPDTPATVQDETFITVYGTHEAGTKGSEGVTQKVTEEGEEIICDICGGEERVPLRTTIAARIDYVQKRIDFMQQGLERGFAVDPKTFVPDPKRKLSEAGRKALEDRITIFQDDIKYYNKLLAEVEKQGKGDEMIICPECGRGYIRWVEFPEYDDPTKRKKTKVPWKMLMDWLWKTLEDAGLEPIQGATVPGEAGFSSQKDRYGFTLKGDFPKQVTLATLSLGKTNRQVHERLAKILTAAQKGQPFKVEPYPSPGLENRVKEENPSPQLLNWLNNNREFYVTTMREEIRPGEDIGLSPFDILPPHNYECKRCGMTALFKDYDPGDAVKCPNCLAKKDDVWNRVIEPTRGGEVDIKRLVAMMGKEEYEEPPEEHKRRLASPMPPLEKREKGWQDIIHLAKTASMGARSKRSKKAAETARASGWYHERHIAPKLEREKLLQARKQWAGPKHEHWDQQVEYLADEADIDNAAMELLIGKYMDNRGDFPTPFDFDRLDIDDAVNALNIIQGIDAKDIMKLAEEARRYFDAILEDRTPSTILDDMAKCLVIDLGSADANALYRDLRAVNGSLDPFCPPVYRETIEFNKTYREAEEMFDALLLEAKPIAKLMRVVPMADLDPWRSKSWAVVLNDAEVSGSLARRNADKIKRMFTEGMRRTAPWALRPLKRLTRAASIEDSPIIAETISHIWNALIDDKPMVYSEYRDALKLATMYGAGELFNACL